MPTPGQSIQCAQILWKPAVNLFEYQCEFCWQLFSDHAECLAHILKCPDNSIKPTVQMHGRGCDPHPVCINEPSSSLHSVVKSESEEPPPENAMKFESVFLEPVKENPHRVEPTKSSDPSVKSNNQRMVKTLPSQRKSEKRSNIEAKFFSNQLLKTLGKLKCDICGQLKDTRVRMLHHMNIFHRPVPSGNPSKPLHQCPKCLRIFSTATRLKTHETTNHERPYQCTICNRDFPTSNTIKFHMKRHLGEKQHQCPKCPMRFVLKTELDRHSVVHTNLKSFLCDLCGESFRSSKIFANHRQTHTGEKPYKCTVCDKAFARHSGWSVHMNTHTGNSPYACKVCDRRFHSSAARRSHEKNVHKFP